MLYRFFLGAYTTQIKTKNILTGSNKFSFEKVKKFDYLFFLNKFKNQK